MSQNRLISKKIHHWRDVAIKVWVSMPFLGLLGGFAKWKKGMHWSASVDFHALFGLVGGVCGAEKGHAFWSKSVDFYALFGLLGEGRGAEKGQPKYVTSEEHDLEYNSVAASGLLWTLLASCKASQPLHWTHVWTLLGEWSGYIAFPLPTLTDDGSHDWPRHGTACLLQPEFRRRLPPFVGWAYPAFEQGALAPLVFPPATFPIIVLPGDKMFQSRDVSPEFQMAPITHTYGGSKTRVGKALRIKGGAAVMPLLMTFCGGDSKLPLWAYPEGCDFIRGSRLINQTQLNAPLAGRQRSVQHSVQF